MKRLDLVFEKLLDMHLVKDVGQVPYLLGRYFDFSASIVCRDNDVYNHLENEVKGLKLVFVRRNAYLHIIRNARRIDALMQFHIRPKSIYQGILYKLLNPGGIFYLKADLKEDEPQFIKKGRRNFISQCYNEAVYRLFVKMVDLVSFEPKRVFSAVTSIPERKKLYLPNGFDVTLPEEMGIRPKTVSEKKNIILCVARHGARQKNSELLLEALGKIGDLGDWRVFFVGPVEGGFPERLKAFRAEHPRHADRIVVAGEITDRKELFAYYNDAKIFCLPSRWESWGIVCTEALYFGCALIMTREVVSADDLTDNGRVGLLAANEDAEEWAGALTGLMHDPALMERLSAEGRRHFDEHFAWPKALEPLARRLSGEKADGPARGAEG
jgi:glycosyltransferase involved in cell wall biosynthesis